MIIDGHSHACGRFLTPDSIITTLDNDGIDKVILVPGELNSKSEYSLPGIASIFPRSNVVKVTNHLTKFVMKLTGKVKEIPSGNEHVYELTQKTNGRVIQFIWVTTQINNPSNYLDNKKNAWDFKGVKLHQCWEDFSIDSAFFREVALWAENNGLPLFIHLYSDTDVNEIIEYKKKHKNLKLIIAHLFGLELFIKQNFKDENLYFDTSTLQLISNTRLMDAINFVGAGKVLFGTDTPYGCKNNIKKNLNRIKDLDILSDDKDLILGENMKRLLEI